MKSAGIMMATLCGLCTSTCAGPAALSLVRGQGDYMAQFVLLVAAVIGVLPALGGVALYFAGHKIGSAARAKPPPSSTPPP